MLKNLAKKVLVLISKISPIVNSKILYFGILRKKLNLKEPQTFNEKLKLNKYVDNELVTKCADKYKVREYVKECGCEETLNELIAVYDAPQQIDFEKLPNQFVLKCNHGCGYNIICKDKNKLDKKKAVKQLKKWMKENYWAMYSEMQYKNIEKKIICEKFLDSGSQEAMKDYKIYCFNGKPKIVLVCLERNTGHTKYYLMNKNWEILKLNQLGIETPSDFYIEKPKCIDEMFCYAEKLAKPFNFVRVDFYDYKGKPVFGELTFTPSACTYNGYTEEAEMILGKQINLARETGEKNGKI